MMMMVVMMLMMIMMLMMTMMMMLTMIMTTTTYDHPACTPSPANPAPQPPYLLAVSPFGSVSAGSASKSDKNAVHTASAALGSASQPPHAWLSRPHRSQDARPPPPSCERRSRESENRRILHHSG
jgi:biopolymer transport protein ExbD